MRKGSGTNVLYKHGRLPWYKASGRRTEFSIIGNVLSSEEHNNNNMLAFVPTWTSSGALATL